MNPGLSTRPVPSIISSSFGLKSPMASTWLPTILTSTVFRSLPVPSISVTSCIKNWEGTSWLWSFLQDIIKTTSNNGTLHTFSDFSAFAPTNPILLRITLPIYHDTIEIKVCRPIWRYVFLSTGLTSKRFLRWC